jgi:hypothetical protein
MFDMGFLETARNHMRVAVVNKTPATRNIGWRTSFRIPSCESENPAARDRLLRTSRLEIAVQKAVRHKKAKALKVMLSYSEIAGARKDIAKQIDLLGS